MAFQWVLIAFVLAFAHGQDEGSIGATLRGGGQSNREEQSGQFRIVTTRENDSSGISVLPQGSLDTMKDKEGRFLLHNWIVGVDDDATIMYLNGRSREFLDFDTTVSPDLGWKPAICTDTACTGFVTANAEGYNCGRNVLASCLDVVVESYFTDGSHYYFLCPYGKQAMLAKDITCNCPKTGNCTASLEYAGPENYFQVDSECTDTDLEDAGDFLTPIVTARLKCVGWKRNQRRKRNKNKE